MHGVAPLLRPGLVSTSGFASHVLGCAVMLELVDLLSNTFRWRVKTLEAELAAARKKVEELESKVETDPLLGIFNRRGFRLRNRRESKASGPRKIRRNSRIPLH